MRSDHPNLRIVRIVARRLGPLREQVVLVGGAAANLLVTDPAAPEIRATRDVDLVVEAAATIEYLRLEDELRRLGFAQDESQHAPRGRWIVDGVKVDFMASDARVAGFSNRWYPLVLDTARPIELEEDLQIRVVHPVAFLATKLEAFRRRGEGDLFGSRDLEDVVAVVDGREELLPEVARAGDEVRSFLTAEVDAHLQHPHFAAAVSGHLGAGEARVPIVLGRLREIRDRARPEGAG